jgi:hypothetical protein
MFRFNSAPLSGLFLLLGCAIAGTPGARDATGGLSGANVVTSGGTLANNGNVNTGGVSAATGGTLAGAPTDAATVSVIVKANFQQRTPAIYSKAMVAGDFGRDAGWNNGLDQGRASIVDEDGNRFLRITYVGGAYGPDDGGVQFKVPVGVAYDELYLAYRIRFAANFDFVKGGKVPGLVGGTAPTGCVSDNGGFSARGMWRTSGAAVQYVYYPEKVNTCGDDFAYAVGATAITFSPGVWHTVEHHVRMNTAGQHDGILEAWFDGQQVLSNSAFLYRIAGATFGIDTLYFSTFFGGGDATWAPAADQVADFDDFAVSTARISP